MIRVVIADDQQLVRAGFRAILEADDQIDVVGEAADGAEAVELCRSQDIDVVLMDIRMSGMDGIEATRMLVSDENAPAVLIVTTFDLDEYVFECLKAGASGFLLKDTPRAELISSVKTIAAGDALLAPEITRRLIEAYVDRGRPNERPPVLALLTDREVDVFKRIAQGLTNGEIATDLVVSEATVKSHVARIFAKLNLRDRAQAVVLAYESGFVRPRS